MSFLSYHTDCTGNEKRRGTEKQRDQFDVILLHTKVEGESKQTAR
jgi:hypothetical protein